jgi:hypothetical protein
VNKAVMEIAKGDQVSEFGFAAVGPVFDMMAMRVTFVAATREAAALVS